MSGQSSILLPKIGSSDFQLFVPFVAKRRFYSIRSGALLPDFSADCDGDIEVAGGDECVGEVNGHLGNPA